MFVNKAFIYLKLSESAGALLSCSASISVNLAFTVYANFIADVKFLLLQLVIKRKFM